MRVDIYPIPISPVSLSLVSLSPEKQRQYRHSDDETQETEEQAGILVRLDTVLVENLLAY